MPFRVRRFAYSVPALNASYRAEASFFLRGPAEGTCRYCTEDEEVAVLYCDLVLRPVRGARRVSILDERRLRRRILNALPYDELFCLYHIGVIEEDIDQAIELLTHPD